MSTRSTLLRGLAATSWSGWLADERLREHDAEPLLPQQRAAIGRILFEMADASDAEGERRQEERAAAALSLVEALASMTVTESTPASLILADVIGRAQAVVRSPDQ